MEDNLKILKVEYLSNHLLDHSQILNLRLDDQILFLSNFKIKSTFNGGWPQKVKSEISQQPIIGSYSNLIRNLRWPDHIFRNLFLMKTTSNGRRHQNIKSGISQQPLIGLYSNFKLKLRWLNHISTNPSNEDDLEWKTTWKYQKWIISATTYWIILKF